MPFHPASVLDPAIWRLMFGANWLYSADCSRYGRIKIAQFGPRLVVLYGSSVTLVMIAAGGRPSVASAYEWQASATCFMLFWHFMRAAAARTFWTAGSSSPIRIAIIAITTRSSMSVKPPTLEAGARRWAGRERKR